MLKTANALKRSSPESVGLASQDILEFVNGIEAEGLELHSLMILKDKNVVAEGWWTPYRRDDVHLLYSLSKSFTSTAIGFAVQEGLVNIDDPVISYFPDQLPDAPSENLKAMKVRHLLSMSTGHEADDMNELRNREDGDWVRGFLAREVVFEPGTNFLYNSSASYVLSAIITKVTAISTLDYLRPRLLDPLGIDKANWDTCPKGISIGASAMCVPTEAIARFGQFYLDKGVWNGERLLNQAWIEDATSFHVSNSNGGDSDWEQGYGFQFWRCRHNCYRGDGAFGQYCIVLSELNMVVAITASVSDMQAVLNLVWKHLLGPANHGAIAENQESHQALQAKLRSLVLPPPAGEPISPIIPKTSGRLFKRTGGAADMETCTFDFDPQGCTFTVRTPKGDRSIRAGTNQWATGTTSIEGGPGKRIASMGRWTSADTYEIKLRYTESPSGLSIVSKFLDDTVKVQFTMTARFTAPEGPTFEGKTG